MNIDGKALLDAMLRASIASSDPQGAKLLDIFTRRGISIIDAMAMLIELAALAEENTKGGEQ